MSMFSPLALTQALPFLPLAQGDIDYQVDRRNDPDLFSSVLSSPVCTVMLVDGGKVAVPKGQGDLVDYDNVKLRLATLPEPMCFRNSPRTRRPFRCSSAPTAALARNRLWR